MTIIDMNQHIGIHGQFMKDKVNIMILGCTGMLGSEVLKVFSESNKFNICASTRIQQNKRYFKIKNLQKINFFTFDVVKDNVKKLKTLIKKNTIIINCIGIIKPNIDENEPKSIFNAIYINSIFPNNLNNEFSKNKIYQIATDCVFDGKNKLYKEDAVHNAQDVYGKSKSLGEITAKNFFNIRTSIIGKEIKGYKSLYDWFLNQEKNSKINGFTNHLWNGLTTRAFGHILISIIENKIKLPNKIHICPKNLITKYKMLKLFNDKNPSKKIIIKPISARIKINRTISTKYKKIADLIWKKSKYKKTPTINELIKEI